MKSRVTTLFDDQLSRFASRSGRYGGGKEDSLPIWVSTFHSSCVRILRRHAKYLDFTSNFAIYDTSDSVSALKRVYKSLGIDPKTLEPRTVLSAIDKAKNAYQFPEDVRHSATLSFKHNELIAEVYQAYQDELRRSNAMDFGDLICNVVNLFQLEPKILARYNSELRHILVDEYQDTNKVQYLLIRQLTKESQNICVVGDDDQSIYGFRGASVETILNFKQDFADAHTITLEQNYRSTRSILAAANAVISKNKRRQAKSMFTDSANQEPIVCFRAYDEKDEAEFVAREILVLLKAGIDPSNIAIFYRTNAQSRAIEEALCEDNLPYRIFGGNRFYDRKEIKDILAYLRLLINPADNEAFLRVVNTPTRGIGATTIAALMTAANKTGVSYYSLLAEVAGVSAGSAQAAEVSEASKARPTLQPALVKKFQPFLDVMSDIRGCYEAAERILSDQHGNQNHIDQVGAIAYLLRDIAERSGYIKSLRTQDSPDSESRIENLEELSRVAMDYSEKVIEQGLTPVIAEFLDRSSLNSDLDESKNEGDAAGETSAKKTFLSLMTLHLAKGLEFDYVFLIGLEEGILPHIRSLELPEDLEEERRLCYVGLTRARKRLHLTRATDRQSFGRSNWYSGEPSRFVWDLPQEYLEDRNSDFLSSY